MRELATRGTPRIRIKGLVRGGGVQLAVGSWQWSENVVAGQFRPLCLVRTGEPGPMA